jgi:hypothetical protein
MSFFYFLKAGFILSAIFMNPMATISESAAFQWDKRRRHISRDTEKRTALLGKTGKRR